MHTKGNNESLLRKLAKDFKQCHMCVDKRDGIKIQTELRVQTIHCKLRNYAGKGGTARNTRNIEDYIFMKERKNVLGFCRDQ